MKLIVIGNAKSIGKEGLLSKYLEYCKERDSFFSTRIRNELNPSEYEIQKKNSDDPWTKLKAEFQEVYDSKIPKETLKAVREAEIDKQESHEVKIKSDIGRSEEIRDFKKEVSTYSKN